MVPAARILEKAIEIDADLIGLSGLITPSLDEMTHVAVGDGAPGLHDPAADRRRDDVADPHGGEDRAGLLRAGRPRPRCVAGGRRRRRARPGRPPRRVRRRDPRRVRDGPPRARGAAGEGAAPDDRRGPRQPRPDRLVGGRRRRGPTFLGPRTFADYPLAELVDFIDWTPFFATWEMRGAYPAILDDPRLGAGGARPPPRRAGPARADRRATGGSRRTRSSGSGRPTRSTATTSSSGATRTRHGGARRRSGPSASRWPSRTAGPNVALADFVAPSRPGVADYVGAFAVTAGHRPRRDRRRVRGRQRRLLGDPRQGPRRPPGRGVRRAAPPARPARAVGLRARRGALEHRPHRRALPGHPAGARATRPVPTTPRRGRSSSCSRRSSGPASG